MKEEFKNGVHEISNDRYHASSGLSRSALWVFKKAPAVYWHQYVNPESVKKGQTPSMVLGDLVHTLTLEPDLANERYISKPDLVPKPEVVRLKDVGRDLFEANKKDREAIDVANETLLKQFNQNKRDRIIITNDQIDQAGKMKKSLESNETFCAMRKDAKIENTIYFTHEGTGLQCKVRPDIWLDGIVGDLKTTESAAPRDFQLSAYKYGYYLQAAMIHEALRSIDIEMKKFIFSCIEKSEPYMEALYVLDQDALAYGIKLFDNLMSRFSKCLFTNEWPGYGIQSLTIPAYANFEE